MSGFHCNGRPHFPARQDFQPFRIAFPALTAYARF